MYRTHVRRKIPGRTSRVKVQERPFKYCTSMGHLGAEDRQRVPECPSIYGVLSSRPKGGQI